jgi:hypothetical protein
LSKSGPESAFKATTFFLPSVIEGGFRLGSVATGVLSVPLRYMHTPSEVLCLEDLDATIQLVCAYCRSVGPNTNVIPQDAIGH